MAPALAFRKTLYCYQERYLRDKIPTGDLTIKIKYPSLPIGLFTEISHCVLLDRNMYCAQIITRCKFSSEDIVVKICFFILEPQLLLRLYSHLFPKASPARLCSRGVLLYWLSSTFFATYNGKSLKSLPK